VDNALVACMGPEYRLRVGQEAESQPSSVVLDKRKDMERKHNHGQRPDLPRMKEGRSVAARGVPCVAIAVEGCGAVAGKAERNACRCKAILRKLGWLRLPCYA